MKRQPENPLSQRQQFSFNMTYTFRKKYYDTTRFKDLDYRLGIVEDNLRLFTDVLNVRESSRLEWIVIVLIFLEIIIALLFHRQLSHRQLTLLAAGLLP